MSSSPTEICNLSISWLAGNRLTSLEDDQSKEADLCRANYDLSRRAVLAEREWTFAIKRVRLPALAETPQSGGYTSQFLVPSDLITGRGVWDPRHSHLRNTPQAPHAFEDDKILCNLKNVDLKYVYDLKNTKRFSPIFDQCLASHIAMNICIPLTENAEHFKTIGAMYLKNLQDASAADGMQGTREMLNRSILEDSRRLFTNISGSSGINFT